MEFSLENLKAILKEYKEQAAEKNEPFGSPFEAMKREILKYEEEKKEKTIEQEAVDEEAEAILNTQKTLSVVIMRKKRQGVKNVRPDARGRKKNVLKRKQNIRKKQKGGLQKGESGRKGNKGIEKKGEGGKVMKNGSKVKSLQRAI